VSKLSLAARNMLVQTPEVQSLVSSGLIASDSEWDNGWVFDNYIIPRALDDKSYTTAVVVSERVWQDPNPHNTMKFPLLEVDIWAAPTRDSSGSIIERDADDLIEEVMAGIMPYFHAIDRGVPGRSGDPHISYMGSPGEVRYWGTEDEILNHTGVPIFDSTHISTEDFRDVEGGNGVRYRSYRFGIETA